MIYKNDMKAFFRRLTELSTEGKRFFFLINYPMTEAMLFDLDSKEEDLNKDSLSFDFGYVNYGYKSTSISPSQKHRELIKHPEPQSEYAKRFDIVYKALKAGEISLINLTLATDITCDQSLKEIYLTSKAKYKVLVENRFVCFSPERFIYVNKDGIVSSHPMKGTISTDVPNAAQVIMDDPKEQAEHANMVKSMEEELAKVGKNVSVPRYRYIDEIHTEDGGLLQVSSEVRAELASDWREHLGEIIEKLLPAGSIAGIPKEAAIRVINEAEHHDRGYYSGISGYFDGEELDTSVMIRFIEQSPSGQLIFHSGGGVTIDSKCEREYKEVLAKIYLPK